MVNQFNRVVLSIEGLNASGKTSLSNKLKVYGYDVYPEIIITDPKFYHLRKFSIDPYTSKEANRCFLNMQLNRIKDAISSKNSVIIDTCIIAQLAYNYAKDNIYGTKNINHLKKLVSEVEIFKIPNPIFIKVSIEESITRLILRNQDNQRDSFRNNEPRYRIEFMEQTLRYYNTVFNLLGENGLTLDGNTRIDKQLDTVIDWVASRTLFLKDFDIQKLFLNSNL